MTSKCPDTIFVVYDAFGECGYTFYKTAKGARKQARDQDRRYPNFAPHSVAVYDRRSTK